MKYLDSSKMERAAHRWFCVTAPFFILWNYLLSSMINVLIAVGDSVQLNM